MRILVISGRAGSGKDTVGEKIASALRIRGERVLVTHYADLLKYILRIFFEWDGKKDENGRALLQKVGTDMVRRDDPDYWVSFLSKMFGYCSDVWDYAVIPDARFPNEIDKLRKDGFPVIHIRVERPGFSGNLTKEQNEHSSETSLNDAPADIRIVNDGTADDLNRKVSAIIKLIYGEEAYETKYGRL